MSGQLTIDRATLERLRAHAASAARLIGHIDALATGPLADHVDTIAYELGELLDNPHLVLDGLVAPGAPTASRTLIADDGMRHELAELPSALTDDESTRPHVPSTAAPEHARFT